MHLGKKEGFKGSKTEKSVKIVRFCKVCLSPRVCLTHPNLPDMVFGAFVEVYGHAVWAPYFGMVGLCVRQKAR